MLHLYYIHKTIYGTYHVPHSMRKNTLEKLTKKNPEQIISLHGNSNDNQ